MLRTHSDVLRGIGVSSKTVNFILCIFHPTCHLSRKYRLMSRDNRASNFHEVYLYEKVLFMFLLYKS